MQPGSVRLDDLQENAVRRDRRRSCAERSAVRAAANVTDDRSFVLIGVGQAEADQFGGRPRL
jgi:hypothetical protein